MSASPPMAAQNGAARRAPKNCRIDVWMPEAVADEIEALARADNRPVSVMALMLIQHSLAEIAAAQARLNGRQQHQGAQA
jgi:hypothetical protein